MRDRAKERKREKKVEAFDLPVSVLVSACIDNRSYSWSPRALEVVEAFVLSLAQLLPEFLVVIHTIKS